MDGRAAEAGAFGGNISQHCVFYFQGRAYGHSKELQVVVIDADMFVTQSLDELCKTELPYESIAASNNWWTSKHAWDDEVFNGGLMVLRPSTETYNKLMAESCKFKSDTGGVQPSLNNCFGGSTTCIVFGQKSGMTRSFIPYTIQ